MGVCGLALAGLGLFSQSPAVGGSATAAPQTTPTQTTTFVAPPAYGDSDGNRDLIAVTGPDQTGSGVLYVIDTQRRQLACYQAAGGSGSQAGIRFLGARRIDLDLQVEGYNDQSKHSFRELESCSPSSPRGRRRQATPRPRAEARRGPRLHPGRALATLSPSAQLLSP